MPNYVIPRHSTSGSHERYKSKERLAWEKKHDCLRQMRIWIEDSGIATIEELTAIEEQAIKDVRSAKTKAWNKFIAPVREEQKELIKIINKVAQNSPQKDTLLKTLISFKKEPAIYRKDLVTVAKQILRKVKNEQTFEKKELELWLQRQNDIADKDYHSHLYSETNSPLSVKEVKPTYEDHPEIVNGSIIINSYFDKAFAKYPNVIAFGEDVGKLGDVNQGFAGLQEKYGVDRVHDTGIREWTIVGQAIGMSQRGLRPIAEIQYLDYIYYGLTPMADDMSSIRYRTNGVQACPAIIRTRGHRLEGIWHSGSPMGMNTLLQGDDPAIVIECLNAYRQKENMPTNLGEYTISLGIPDCLREGRDLTIVTYGACVKVTLEASELLAEHDVEVEVIDIQTLLPFDINHSIVESLKKTKEDIRS